jgi:hypothetical protein
MASVLLGLSLVVVSHPPPIGPSGLVCFAGAAGLLAITRWSSTVTARPASIGGSTPESARARLSTTTYDAVR